MAPDDFERRRQARHDRVRKLESRVKRLRRRARGRKARRRFANLRFFVVVALLVGAWFLVPRFIGGGSSEVVSERRTPADVVRDEIEELETALVEDVEEAVDAEVSVPDRSIDFDGVVIDGWAAPLERIDGDRATRPHHTYAAWDYGTRVGTAVYAMTDGRIASAVADDGARCGGTVILSTASEGADITYCHLSEVWVERGDRVSAGAPLGLTGGKPGTPGAGRSSGPHLHLQIKLDGELRCPQAQLVALAAGESLDVGQLPTAGCSYQSSTYGFAGSGATAAADPDDPLFAWDP